MARAGRTGAIAALERLTGGANMESWAFAQDGEAFVLRRAPSADVMAGRPLDHAGEAALIRAARAAGVPAPEVVAELAEDDGIGSGFVMRRIAGTASPAPLLEQGGEAMLDDIAQALAAIHRVEPATLGDLPGLDPGAGVEGLAAQFAGHGANRPIVALGLAWLRANLPAPVDPALVHGDFRIGNLMAENGRLTGVLDWEIAHLGDHHEDLAYGCMAVWRFGSAKPGFGLGSLEQWFAAYEDAGGRAVDPARFRFWLVYRTVWWALGCLGMGQTWRSHADRSLERVVVARRAAEQELDLLLLLEDEAPEAERARPLPASPDAPPAPRGEPDTGELLVAVSEWLGTIKERFSGRDRFDLAVARNALGIATRELATRPQAHDRPLADELLAGRAGLATPGLLARLRRIALDKLAADVPKYPGLADARAKWEG
ncbi:MAG TPA: phosphotransferase [Novosphingobium sp.]|nr:phosphotransferase [Novosphingobium sp.]